MPQRLECCSKSAPDRSRVVSEGNMVTNRWIFGITGRSVTRFRAATVRQRLHTCGRQSLVCVRWLFTSWYAVHVAVAQSQQQVTSRPVALP